MIKLTLKTLVFFVAVLLLSSAASAQNDRKPERVGSKIIGEEGTKSIIGEDSSVAIIGEDSLVSIIGEDSLVSIIGEDSLVVVVAPVDSRGALTLRSTKTGRTLQMRPARISAMLATQNNPQGTHNLVSLRSGDRLKVKSGSAAMMNSAVERYLVSETELPKPCCSIVKTEKDSTEPLKVWVTAQNNTTQKKFKFAIPDGSKFKVANGQPLSMIIGPSDSQGTWVLLPSSSPGIKGRPKVYIYGAVAPDM